MPKTPKSLHGVLEKILFDTSGIEQIDKMFNNPSGLFDIYLGIIKKRVIDDEKKLPISETIDT